MFINKLDNICLIPGVIRDEIAWRIGLTSLLVGPVYYLFFYYNFVMRYCFNPFLTMAFHM